MTKKYKMTVRFVIERDYEIEALKEGRIGSCLMIGDAMVMSGFYHPEFLTHENIFDRPISGYRPVKVDHGDLISANLYNALDQNPNLEGWKIEEMK
jgi:hypothetical protein